MLLFKPWIQGAETFTKPEDIFNKEQEINLKLLAEAQQESEQHIIEKDQTV